MLLHIIRECWREWRRGYRLAGVQYYWVPRQR